MLRLSLILLIAALAGLIALVLLLRLGRRHADGTAVISWHHIVAAAVGLAVFVTAAYFLGVGSTGQPGTDYQPPRIEDGQIQPGEFTAPSGLSDS